MCNWRACPRIAVRGSMAVSVLVTIGVAKRSDQGGMNHLSGDQIIRLLFPESQEFVDELWLTAFATARHPAHAHPPLVWPPEVIANPSSELRHSQARRPPGLTPGGGAGLPPAGQPKP